LPYKEKIAFQADTLYLTSFNLHIYIINADGSNQINLSKNSAYDNEPICAPDGKKILFVSDRDGNNEIYMMDSDGSNQIKFI